MHLFCSVGNKETQNLKRKKQRSWLQDSSNSYVSSQQSPAFENVSFAKLCSQTLGPSGLLQVLGWARRGKKLFLLAESLLLMTFTCNPKPPSPYKKLRCYLKAVREWWRQFFFWPNTYIDTEIYTKNVIQAPCSHSCKWDYLEMTQHY